MKAWGRRFNWRVYGYRGGRKLEVYTDDWSTGTVYDLSYWVVDNEQLARKLAKELV